MRRYLFSSAGLHFSILGFFLLFSWMHRSTDVLIIDGFDYMGGGGGGGNGQPGGGGPKQENMGQVVPQPIKAPVPAKPAPIQKAVSAEETWAVKNAKTAKPAPEQKQPELPVERGEKAQKEQSNMIRIGVAQNTKAGDGSFDFGTGEGSGKGEGKGPGIGIGFGPGEGGGFGGFSSYLRVLRQRIWSEWTQSAVYGSNEVCVVGLTVSRSGDVSDIKVEKASNNPFYDNVALRAVRNASPLPPLPASFPNPSQRFRIKFRLIE